MYDPDNTQQEEEIEKWYVIICTPDINYLHPTADNYYQVKEICPSLCAYTTISHPDIIIGPAFAQQFFFPTPSQRTGLSEFFVLCGGGS